MSPPLRGDTSRGDRGLGPPSYAPMDMNVDCIWLFDTLNMNVRDGYKYAVGRLLNYGQNCTLIQKNLRLIRPIGRMYTLVGHVYTFVGRIVINCRSDLYTF